MNPESHRAYLPQQIRVSAGTAVVIGIQEAKIDAAPTTGYLMTYRQGKCTANCAFCPQAKKSESRADMLSRVSWPVYSTRLVLDGMEKAVRDGCVKRVCIQALNYSEVFTDLEALVRAVHLRAKVPVSVSSQPPTYRNIGQLADAGAERIAIPLDAATREIFERTKGSSAEGPYIWEKQFELLNEAVKIFGKGKVSTHLIVGLGETEREMVETVQKCSDMNVLPALFAFTPVAGTALQAKAQPPIRNYRRMQVARHLILHGVTRFENMSFNDKGQLVDFGVEKEKLMPVIQTGIPFLTSGCPNCNRPYYNEKPGGLIYNYPRELTKTELLEIQRQVF
jgi:biotin synthase